MVVSNGCARSFRPMTAETAATASNAEQLQALFVRLLFCDTTFQRYKDDSAGLAGEYGIAASALAALPDAEAPQLLAERHGRKTGVMGEVKKVFAQSIALVQTLPEFDFDDFLCSDAFFDDASGLPHPFGVGPGYENASKFYFWARETLDFSGSPERLQTRLMMNGDFAAYLIDQHERGADAYYRRFANGIFWREAATAMLPVIYMSAERHVFRIADDAGYRQMRSTGAIDLDLLMPEPPEHGPNIR